MSNDLSYSGPAFKSDTALVTRDEVQSGEVKAPEGTTPYQVQLGDCLYDIAKNNGYGDPPDMQAFYQDNPQYAERNPDLIYPGEVVFVRSPTQDANNDSVPDTPPDNNMDGVPDQATDVNGDNIPDSANSAQAAATTDAAAQQVENAKKTDYPPGLQHEKQEAVNQANQQFFNAVQGEIETGLREYMANNPNATPEQINTEANRLRHQIQGRTSTAAGMDDASMDYRTQQAVNTVSAQQRGVDLGAVAPGTKINDGPYTDSQGPFEPNASVKLKDGTYIKTDEHGYPDQDADNNGVADPTTPQAASQATDSAAQQLQQAQNMQVPGGLRHEKEDAIAQATTQVGNAVQQEIEVGLRAYIAQHPNAKPEDIQNEANRLGHAILAREGNSGVISESQVDFRVEQAVASVTQGK